MTLTTRLAIAMIALLAIAVTAVGWLSYRNLEQALLLRARDRIETHSRQVCSDMPLAGSVPPARRARTNPCSAVAERNPATSPVALAA